MVRGCLFLIVQAYELRGVVGNTDWFWHNIASEVIGDKLPSRSKVAMEPTVRTRKVRFGAFDVDLRLGQLHKHGIRLKLQDQPFQVLALLLASR